MSTTTLTPEARGLLDELADFLDELPEERFDYARWVGRGWQGAPDLSCGAPACAIGWATTLSSFRERGLSLMPGEALWPGTTIVRSVGFGAVPHHAGTGATGMEAVQALLDISYDEACFLFNPHHSWRGMASPDTDASPREVATHIRRYVDLMAELEA